MALLEKAKKEAKKNGKKVSAEVAKGLKAIQAMHDICKKQKIYKSQHLLDIFEECSVGGWDGDQGQPITVEILRNSWIFLDSLPLGIEAPSISAEPDGLITFEWYRNPRRVLSVSIGPNGWLYYAALIGTSKRHGADSIQMDVSEDLIQLINQIIED